MPVIVNEVQNESLRIYPNPASDYLILDSDEMIIKIELRDMLGRLIHEEKANNNFFNLDLSGLNSGIYVLTTTLNSVKQMVNIVVKN